MKIYCCGCKHTVEANLITGATAYPHRKDLHGRNFWQCPACKNFVGCHPRWGRGEFMPLGVIATPEIRQARMKLHAVLDPLWRSGRIRRKKIYAKISEHLGYEFHTANTRSLEEIQKVKDFIIQTWGHTWRT